MKKILVFCLACVFLFAGLSYMGSSNAVSSTTNRSVQPKDPNKTVKKAAQKLQKATQPLKAAVKTAQNPVVTIEMEDGQKIKVELYPEVAPNTVKNYISLVKKGFYNGQSFHRVIPGFMIQGGDPAGNGSGGPGYSIKGEFGTNGFVNNLQHKRGIISMARTNRPDSAGSQFFIMVADAPFLDGDYAAFGKVLSGLEEVDKIVNAERDASDKPLKLQKMKTVTVDTFGVEYPEPVKS